MATYTTPVVCSILDVHSAHREVVRKYNRRGEAIGIVSEWDCPGYDGETRPVTVFTPDSHMAEWPGESEVYFREGYARTVNEYDGSKCQVRVNGDESSTYPGNAWLELDEMRLLRDELDRAIDEMVKLRQKWEGV